MKKARLIAALQTLPDDVRHAPPAAMMQNSDEAVGRDIFEA
jgi:hypothetical protein